MQRVFESKPTYFIEQFFIPALNMNISASPQRIHLMESYLGATSRVGHTTIAVFKITPKKLA